KEFQWYEKAFREFYGATDLGNRIKAHLSTATGLCQFVFLVGKTYDLSQAPEAVMRAYRAWKLAYAQGSANAEALFAEFQKQLALLGQHAFGVLNTAAKIVVFADKYLAVSG